ncbi:MAG: hypothetical protein ABSE68_00460 [Minisyncoccia bacterium]
MDFTNSFLNPFLIYLPKVFSAGVILLAAFFYLRVLKNPEDSASRLKKLAVWVIGFRFFYALILTLGQYFVWNEDQFGKLFLKQPNNYFIFYSWERFWLDAVLSAVIAFLFWFFLKALQKKESRFFCPGETELGLALTIAVGWPDCVIFIPLTFLLVVLFSLFRMIFLKESYTTIGWPFIFAAALTLISGSAVLSSLGLLGVLN